MRRGQPTPFLSAIEVVYNESLYKSTFNLLYLTTVIRRNLSGPGMSLDTTVQLEYVTRWRQVPESR